MGERGGGLTAPRAHGCDLRHAISRADLAHPRETVWHSAQHNVDTEALHRAVRASRHVATRERGVPPMTVAALLADPGRQCVSTVLKSGGE